MSHRTSHAISTQPGRRGHPTIEEIRKDKQARESVEALADREDQIGAAARVVLAIADRERPAPEDCEDAGVASINRMLGGEDE